MSSSPSLKVSDITKSFEREAGPIDVLKGISFEMTEGQSLAITGPSGSGKSTLLHLIGSLDRPSAGLVEINGIDPAGLREPELARFRNRVVGFVFQDHHLLQQYSVLENVLIPTLAHGKPDSESENRAREILERVGLSERLDHLPSALSGGECQRVAVARALINRPALLLCDEPTGNLDRNTAHSVASVLFELHRAEKNILIVVTHSLDHLPLFDRCLELKEGTCVEV